MKNNTIKHNEDGDLSLCFSIICIDLHISFVLSSALGGMLSDITSWLCCLLGRAPNKFHNWALH